MHNQKVVRTMTFSCLKKSENQLYKFIFFTDSFYYNDIKFDIIYVGWTQSPRIVVMLMLMLYTQLVRLRKGHMHVSDQSVWSERIVVVNTR